MVFPQHRDEMDSLVFAEYEPGSPLKFPDTIGNLERTTVLCLRFKYRFKGFTFFRILGCFVDLIQGVELY